MAERPIFKAFEFLVSLPFRAVVVRIPEDIPFIAKTTNRSKNLRSIKIDERTVDIPTGAGGTISTPEEFIEIEDWSQRPGKQPGASVRINSQKTDLALKDNKITTPKGVEIIYHRR